MGYRPQQPQQPQGGYGQQPELRPGATVVSADGAWRGTVVDLTGQGADAAVRVQWDGYGLTYVTLGMLMHDNGRWVVRSEGQAQGGQAAQNPQAQAGGQNPREGRGAGDANEAARMAAQPQRAPVQQPVAGDEMTQMAAPPRPVAQPAPQPQAMQGQAVRPAPSPYYPQGASVAEGREVAEMREVTPLEARGDERVVVPIIEEQLEAHPEWRESGNVRLGVRTEEVQQSVTQDVQREEVLVERVAVGRALAEGEEVSPRQEGDMYIMPVIVEEVVVSTRRVLAEEVRVTKRMVTVPQTVEATLRRQQVEVEGGTLSDRIHDRRDER